MINAKAEIVLYGGAVLCLLFDQREITKDIDAVFRPKKEMYKAIKNVGDIMNLTDDWFNDSVKGFISSKEDNLLYLNLSNLIVETTSPEYLLAMKVLSSRLDESEDIGDIKFLITYLELKSSAEVLSIVIKYYPQKRIPQKAYYMLCEIFEGSV